MKRETSNTNQARPLSRLSPRYAFACLILLVMVTAGCGAGRQQQGSGQTGATEINVGAASNLSDAFKELGEQFTARTGIRVVYSFGATADLAKQIEQGAPFDVFAAADVEHVEALNRQGLILPDTLLLYARGQLVLWTPAGSRLKLSRIEDINRAEVERISIAKPDVAPYGRATVEALTALNLWKDVEPKVVYGQNVTQTKQYAATGNADAAFIPRSLVREGEGQSIAVDERLHQPINQALAVTKSSVKQTAARQFAQYVLSPEGQALLERYGYKKAVASDK
ncbi:MAG TPA: molybdate ABC transporter substrate-binding protein [Pyrinomonadaceae bacterium]|nr:molybdate ABC transporter substrate-binding protein [Pyrinomonadaceae bacterium]